MHVDVVAASLSLVLMAAASGGSERPAELERLAFLAGRWRLQGEGGGQGLYRWHPGDLWLGFDVATTMPGAGRYEVTGGVTFDPQSGAYVAYAINNLAPRVIEYRGRFTDAATLVFDGVGAGASQRVQYARVPDGTVVFSASQSPDGKAYHTYFEAVLERQPEPSASLDALVTAIRAADYQADRAELLRLVRALEGAQEPAIAPYARYWQGFARWRRALNGFNVTPTPTDLRSDLEAAVRSFRESLALRPGWIEPTIGIVGSYANLLFLSSGDPEGTQRILAEYVPAMREMTAKAAGNPRALWLIGGTELGAPPPWGGDARKAAATLRRGLAAARREASPGGSWPAYVPAWGGAENLMSLAYLYSHSALEDRALARAYVEATLTLVPRWHYVSDVLLPQIEALPGPR